MRYTVTGKNFEVTEALKDIAVAKISKMEKFFNTETSAIITMSVDKKVHKIEVTIPIKGSVIRAEEHEETMYAAIDLVVDKLERQLIKHRSKIVDRHRHSDAFKNTYLDYEEEEEEGKLEIVRSKRFAMKPMDAEEACMELELLGHDFFVFRSSETDEVNVVYKRKNGTFGLIEPEI
jgi:putative sigma-54 modulation protein